MTILVLFLSANQRKKIENFLCGKQLGIMYYILLAKSKIIVHLNMELCIASYSRNQKLGFTSIPAVSVYYYFWTKNTSLF